MMGKVLYMRKGGLLKKPGSRLPSGYTELTYIQSSGTQYVNSNFKANQNTRVVIDFEYISGDVVFGAYDTNGANGYGLQAADGKWYIYYGSKGSAYSSTNVVANTRLVADLNKNVSSLNGNALMTATANTFAGANPLIISGLYNASEPGFLTSLKIYSFQIYDNGTLVRDYVPCINPSGEVGLYDLVGKKFYGNSGTGAFGAGDVVEYSLPDGYEELAYIQSSGTQYIDTQVPFSADNYNKIKLSVEMDAANAYHAYEVNGTGTSGSNCFYVGNYDGFVAYGDGKKDSIFGQVHQTGRCKYTIDAKNGIVSADGVDDVEFTPYAPSVSANICVCGFGRTSGTATGFSGKFYAAQLLVDGAYFRLYVPCVTENGDVGMYDVITRTFYGNAGTGTFIGSEVA